jgi:hypothetical protein
MSFKDYTFGLCIPPQEKEYIAIQGGYVMNTRERGYSAIRGRHDYAGEWLHCNTGGHEYAGEGNTPVIRGDMT